MAFHVHLPRGLAVELCGLTRRTDINGRRGAVLDINGADIKVGGRVGVQLAPVLCPMFGSIDHEGCSVLVNRANLRLATEATIDGYDILCVQSNGTMKKKLWPLGGGPERRLNHCEQWPEFGEQVIGRRDLSAGVGPHHLWLSPHAVFPTADPDDWVSSSSRADWTEVLSVRHCAVQFSSIDADKIAMYLLDHGLRPNDRVPGILGSLFVCSHFENNNTGTWSGANIRLASFEYAEWVESRINAAATAFWCPLAQEFNAMTNLIVSRFPTTINEIWAYFAWCIASGMLHNVEGFNKPQPNSRADLNIVLMGLMQIGSDRLDGDPWYDDPTYDRSLVVPMVPDVMKRAEFIDSLFGPSIVDTCGMCGNDTPRGSTAKRCACKHVKYCNGVCQKSHWPLHRFLCTVGIQRASARAGGAGSSTD